MALIQVSDEVRKKINKLVFKMKEKNTNEKITQNYIIEKAINCFEKVKK